MLVTPGLGLIFWTTITFLLLVFLLSRFAWKPIVKALKDREGKIDEALNAAQKAREEMAMLQINNDKLLHEAKEQRDAILTDARKLKDAILEEAKENAKQESDRIIAAARESIHFEKMSAMTELKNQLAQLSLEIAEKVLDREFETPEKHQQYVSGLLKDVNFN